MLITIFYYAGLSYLLLVGAWLFLLTFSSWLYQPKKAYREELLRLAVIVPAHNEQEGILATIAAIRKTDYPQDKLQVIVIADNCSDATAHRAKNSGALVFERNDSRQRGKGQALDWLLRSQQQLLAGFDALAFVDADAIPDRMMFRELSASLSVPGVDVVQGFNGVANSGQNWRTALTTAAFNVFNHLRMAGSSVLFGSAMLKGLGMAFRSELLLRTGWPAHSVVEDLEFTTILARQKVSVHYNPDAIIRSEMAATRSQADNQRSRWEGGRLRLARQLLPGLFWQLLKGDWRQLHIILDLLVLPLSMLVLLLSVWTGLGAWQEPNHLFWYSGLWLMLIFYVASGQLQRKLPARQWLYLLAAPAFVLWKLLLYLRLPFSTKARSWVRTRRRSELSSSPGSQT